AAEEMAQSILIQIFALLAREARSTEDAEKRLARLIIPNDSMNPTISQIIDYLNIHYCENISLNSIAKKFGITESHLSRIFKNASHFTFVEYINSLRITRCCQILTESNKTMLEISELCGFGSITQFGRCFKKYTGKAPLKYKKEALSKLK
ncbi:MAG: AraC family transcriptional regulator, partial [Treponema sp.]|nr:AraC family transcriptional regulator [Treponema sp.]